MPKQKCIIPMHNENVFGYGDHQRIDMDYPSIEKYGEWRKVTNNFAGISWKMRYRMGNDGKWYDEGEKYCAGCTVGYMKLPCFAIFSWLPTHENHLNIDYETNYVKH